MLKGILVCKTFSFAHKFPQRSSLAFLFAEIKLSAFDSKGQKRFTATDSSDELNMARLKKPAVISLDLTVLDDSKS